MSIFKSLKSLRHSNRNPRLLQWLLVAGGVAVIATTFFSKRLEMKEQSMSCFNDNRAHLFFHASKPLTPRISLSIKPMQALQNLSFLEVIVQGKKWKIAALEIFSIGDLLAEFSTRAAEKYSFPLITLARDSIGEEYLIVCDEEKQISLSSLKYLIAHCLVEQKNENLIKVMISNPKNSNESLSVYIAINYVGLKR
jgi:hypothetical protein